MSSDSAAQLGFLSSLPQSQRSIVLLSAVMLVMHPRGGDIVREVHAHYPGLDGHELCRQVIVELMTSISRNWTPGSPVLMPVAVLIDQTVSKAARNAGVISPVVLAEQLWDLITELHDEAGTVIQSATVDPSRN